MLIEDQNWKGKYLKRRQGSEVGRSEIDWEHANFQEEVKQEISGQ